MLMKTLNILLPMVALLAMFTITNCTQPVADVTDEISNAHQAFAEAYNQGDLVAVSHMYAEDGKLFPSDFNEISGRDNIVAFWAKAPEMGIKKILIETLAAEGHGDIAIEEGRYTLYTHENIIMDEGKFVATWEREPSGWLINRFIWTSDQAFAGGHNLQAGHMLGLHTLEIILKENVTFSDFEKFYKETYIPNFERSFPGTQLYFLKVDRGESTGKYGELYFARSVEERDYFEPGPGVLSDKGIEGFERLKPIQDKLNDMVEFKRVYSDWVVQ